MIEERSAKDNIRIIEKTIEYVIKQEIEHLQVVAFQAC
jgi:hypothetical protein